MDTSRFKSFLDSAKTYLLSKMSREAFAFAFFLLLSTIFWLSQALNETYEEDLEYELILKNVPEGTVITSELKSPIHISVRDKGTSLIRYHNPFKKKRLVIDFQHYDKGADYARVILPHSDIEKLLQTSMDPSTRVLLIRPDTLDYYFNRGIWKRVPVEFIGHVETDPLSYLAGMTIEPDSVTVWAEKKFLDSLQVVHTVQTLLPDLKKTTVKSIPLAPIKGVKIDPEEVKLTAEVDIYTEKHVEVPIIGTNFPGGYTLRTFPATATISFRIGAKYFTEVTADNFVLTATYEELMALPDSILHLSLRSIPEGISQVKIQPEAVQFLIEQTGE